MPRPAERRNMPAKKRPLPDEDLEEAEPSDSDDAHLTADELRALKRFKANLDDDEDEDEDEAEEDEEDEASSDDEAVKNPGGGARKGRKAGSSDDDEEDDEDEEDEDEDGSDSEGASDDDADGERTLEEQMADVPFEELEVLRRDGSGLVGAAARTAAARAAVLSFKRENKDRPQEMSSKRPVGRFREVIQVPRKESRDPRFDSSGGPAPGDTFRRRYAFLYDEMLPAEKSELMSKIKKEKNPKFKARLQSQLQCVDAQLRDENLRRRTQKLESEWKTKERSAVAGGKSPYFLKASEKKRLALLAKYQELQERGKLDKFMEKRRKKNAAKDHRYLPSGRRQQTDN